MLTRLLKGIVRYELFSHFSEEKSLDNFVKRVRGFCDSRGQATYSIAQTLIPSFLNMLSSVPCLRGFRAWVFLKGNIIKKNGKSKFPFI
ncbi:MAG: hypothetical protein OEZ36_05715 [Spirochaetota bacterium]|nr:hypothetical protein [Spirochaetota bacterium]